MATKQPEVTPQPTTAIEHPEVIPGPAYGQIDYNKLAEAMLAISKQQPENAPSQNTSDDRQMPVTLESPSTSQSAEPATTSTLGTLLDQIFLGDRSTHKDLSPLSKTISLTDGIPLSSTVSQKTKTKIWNNEFVDLRSLLSVRDEPLSVSISSGIINVQQSPKFKFPISISQWTDAFLIFASIYIEKFPQEAPHLFKYCHMVREIQQLHGDNAFRAYDEHFRKLRESVVAPWQIPVQELRLKAITLPKPGYQNKTALNQPFRVKYCYQFNKGERCTRSPCQFRHSCMQCKGNHPKVKCSYSFKSNSNSKSTNPNQDK